MPTNSWAENRANELLNEFKAKGLVGQEWTFGWNRRKNAFGLCSYTDKKIYLSIYFPTATTETDVEDTLRHEIAHIISGAKARHGIAWQRACYITGAKPFPCKSVENMPCVYKGKCPVCGTFYHAQRMLKNMDKRLCGKRMCGARALKRYVIWETNNGK